MNDENDQEIEYISKSQMKREMLALQDLGERLVALHREQLNQLDLPEELMSAILMAQSIGKRGAKKRQLQYIGRIMRNVDADHILQEYNRVTLHSAESINQLHRIEKWREKLIESGDEALSEFISEFPGADRQQLRSLVRSTVQERHSNSPPKHFRRLFQFIKQCIDSWQAR